MDSLQNHGIIIRELRRRLGLSVQKTANMIGKSAGWLCEVENNNGTSRLSSDEFDRIVELLGGSNERAMFKTWIANYKNLERINTTYDGAVLRFIRIKKEISLSDAAKKIGISKGHLSKLETGTYPITLKKRNSIMKAYGYSPSSFKNLSTDPVRSKAVPNKLKFIILLQKISEEQAESIFHAALESFKVS